jgi:3-hydroxyacyl-CoA dehydrogenase
LFNGGVFIVKKVFKRAGVIGAGVMGVNIAAMLVNCGLDTCLIDLASRSSDIGTDYADKDERNSIAIKGIERAKKKNPPPFIMPEYADRIKVGNIEDDISLLSYVDIIIEAVTENINVKRDLYKKIEGVIRPGTIVTSNTSGISPAKLCEGLKKEFKEHFAVTHFFNPPRYMKLVEVVKGPDTLPEVVCSTSEFCEKQLEKHAVMAGDTPNFIANRIAVFTTFNNIRVMTELGLSFEAIDELTGTLTGFAKSATLRTTDIVGVDTLIHAARNVFDNAPLDERRDIFAAPIIFKKMVEKGILGDKSGSGFYKKIIDNNGTKQILVLDINTMEYRQRAPVMFETLEVAKGYQDTGSRLKVLYYGRDRAGIFTFRTRSDEFIYAAKRVPEIAEDIITIDNALKWGFNREVGPFEMWDAVGLIESVAHMRQAGYEIPSWVEHMLENGFRAFYIRRDGIRYYYDPLKCAYREKANTKW